MSLTEAQVKSISTVVWDLISSEVDSSQLHDEFLRVNTTLKIVDPTKSGELDEANHYVDEFKDRFLERQQSPEEALREVLQPVPSASVAPTHLRTEVARFSIYPKDNTELTAGKKMVGDFMGYLNSHVGVYKEPTGDKKTKQKAKDEYLDKTKAAWIDFKNTHKDAPGLKSAEDTLVRLFGIGFQLKKMLSRDWGRASRSDLLQGNVEYLTVALLFLQDLMSIVGPISTDSWVSKIAFGIMGINPDSLNQELRTDVEKQKGVNASFKDPLYRQIGPLTAFTGNLDSKLDALPNKQRWVVQNLVSVMSFIPALMTNIRQTQDLAIPDVTATPASQDGDSIRNVVEKLLKDLYLPGGGDIAQSIRSIAYIDTEAPAYQQVVSYVTTLAHLAAGVHRAYNSAVYLQRATYPASLFPDNPANNTTAQSTSIAEVLKAVPQGQVQAGWSALAGSMVEINYALTELAFAGTKYVDPSKTAGLKKALPFIIIPITTVVFEMALAYNFSQNPKNAFGGLDPTTFYGCQDLIRKGVAPQAGDCNTADPNKKPTKSTGNPGEVIKNGAVGFGQQSIANAILAGAAASILAMLSRDPRQASVNWALFFDLTARNRQLTRGAYIGNSTDGDYPNLSGTMVKLVQIVNNWLPSIFEAIEHGAGAAKTKHIYEMDWTPWAASFLYRVATLGLDSKEQNAAAKSGLLLVDGVDLGIYGALSLTSFLVSRTLGRDLNLNLKFEAGGLKIALRPNISGSNFGISGTNGVALPKPAATLDDQIAHNIELLKDRQTLRNKIIREQRYERETMDVDPAHAQDLVDALADADASIKAIQNQLTLQQSQQKLQATDLLIARADITNPLEGALMPNEQVMRLQESIGRQTLAMQGIDDLLKNGHLSPDDSTRLQAQRQRIEQRAQAFNEKVPPLMAQHLQYLAAQARASMQEQDPVTGESKPKQINFEGTPEQRTLALGDLEQELRDSRDNLLSEIASRTVTSQSGLGVLRMRPDSTKDKELGMLQARLKLINSKLEVIEHGNLKAFAALYQKHKGGDLLRDGFNVVLEGKIASWNANLQMLAMFYGESALAKHG